MGTSATITTTNTTATAATINVNTSGGGTGNASLGAISVGSSSGGTLTVNSNGGSILNDTTASLTTNQIGTVGNGGSAPSQVISAVNYLFTATGSGSIGTTTVPIETTNFGSDGVGDSNFSLNAGNGGAYLTDWGSIDVTVTGASATGPGNIRIVTGNASGHNLWVTGNVSAVTGNIYLASDDNLEVEGPSTVIGGAGFSGTVWMQGNRDQSSTGQPTSFQSGDSIVTSNTTNTTTALAARTPTTQAVYIDIGGGTSSGVGLVTVGNITVGDGGRVVLNGSCQQLATQAGSITMAGTNDVINVGPTGTLELDAILSSTTNADNIGTSASPIVVAGGNVVINSQFGNVWVSGTAATNYSGSFTTITGQTASNTLNLATTSVC